MRPPSRRQRQLVDQPQNMSLWGRLVLGLVLAGLIAVAAVSLVELLWPMWKHPVVGLSVATALTFVLATAIANTRRLHEELRQLAAQRQGESICQFVRSFDWRHTDTWVLRAVYEELQAYAELQKYASFAIHTGDTWEQLGIDGEDLVLDIAPSIARRSRRTLRDADRNPFNDNVATVRDLVNFFLHQPREAG
jgi:hypothetical protein